MVTAEFSHYIENPAGQLLKLEAAVPARPSLKKRSPALAAKRDEYPPKRPVGGGIEHLPANGPQGGGNLRAPASLSQQGRGKDQDSNQNFSRAVQGGLHTPQRIILLEKKEGGEYLLPLLRVLLLRCGSYHSRRMEYRRLKGRSSWDGLLKSGSSTPTVTSRNSRRVSSRWVLNRLKKSTEPRSRNRSPMRIG